MQTQENPITPTPENQPAPSKEARYLAHWDAQKTYYARKADYYKNWHFRLLTTSTVCALFVTFLLSIPEFPRWVPAFFSFLAASLLGLDNLYQFGQHWRSHRQTSEALRNERALYDAHVGMYKEANGDNFALFVARSQELMVNEGKTYWPTVKNENTDGKQKEER